MTYDGKHRCPDLSPTPLSRRALLLSSGVLASSAALGFAGTFGTSSEPRIVQQAKALTGDVPRKPSKEAAVPLVHTTKEWGARKARGKATLVSHAPRYIVIHHTTTPNIDDFSLAQAERLARSIQTTHMNQQGWPDTGQHFTISRGGHILEGRHGSLAAARKGEYVIGTHARQANAYSVGIECEGTYSTVMPPRKLLSSLVRMCAWLCVQYDLDPQKAIVPHRKFTSTECCGDKFASSLPRLRDEVEKAVPKLRATLKVHG